METEEEGFWKRDYIELMYNNESDSYGCFGCNELGSETPICVNPIKEMKAVPETEERHCGKDFEIIEG